MPAINLDSLSRWFSAFIDQLPTEAMYRGRIVNVRVGEAPQTRQFLIAGIRNAQGIEALISSEDCITAPQNGELITVGGNNYKIVSVTALLSLSDPPAYRLIISRL
jgi:hypothetical protein